jgi:hypothetical protein
MAIGIAKLHNDPWIAIAIIVVVLGFSVIVFSCLM